jgi:hypothetical protein
MVDVDPIAAAAAAAALKAASDLAALKGQLVSLREAYRTGAAEVSYEGKQIRYRSAEDMRAAIASLENEIGTQQQARTIVIRGDKGW